MLEELRHQTRRAQVGTLDDVHQLDDVGVLQSLEEMVLPFDLDRVYGQKDLDGYFFLGGSVSSLEDVGVSAPPHLMGNGILLQLAE